MIYQMSWLLWYSSERSLYDGFRKEYDINLSNGWCVCCCLSYILIFLQEGAIPFIHIPSLSPSPTPFLTTDTLPCCDCHPYPGLLLPISVQLLPPWINKTENMWKDSHCRMTVSCQSSSSSSSSLIIGWWSCHLLYACTHRYFGQP